MNQTKNGWKASPLDSRIISLNTRSFAKILTYDINTHSSTVEAHKSFIVLNSGAKPIH